MTESTFLRIEPVGSGLIAQVRCEKVGGREAPILQQELLGAAEMCHWRIAIDFSVVTLLSSMGLGTLVTLQKRCRENGGVLVIFGLGKEVAEVLKLTHLDRILNIVPDRGAAAKAVG